MAPKAHRLGPGSLKFGEVGTPQEFAAQLTNARISPSINEEDPIDVLSGEQIDGEDTIDWTIAGTLNQSFDKAGLIHWCFENRLTKVPFEFTPSLAESDYKWTGIAKIVPIEAGGDVKTRNTSDFEFKVIGEPALVDIP